MRQAQRYLTLFQAIPGRCQAAVLGVCSTYSCWLSTITEPIALGVRQPENYSGPQISSAPNMRLRW